MREWRPILLFGVLLILGLGAFRSFPDYPVMETEPVEWTVEEPEGLSLTLVGEPGKSIRQGSTFRYRLENQGPEVWHYDGPILLQQELEGEWYTCNSTRRPRKALDLTLEAGEKPYEDILSQRAEGYGNRLSPGRYRLAAEVENGAGERHYIAVEFTR